MPRFFSPNHDFWPLYEHISQYYALGLIPEYPEQIVSPSNNRKLEAQLVENIHDEVRFQKWQEFEKEIAAAVRLPLIGNTYGQAPCFSTIVEIEQTAVGNQVLTKELFLAVSLLGPFYIVLGRDQLVTTLPEAVVRTTSHLTISPQDAYKQAFETVCAHIEKRFTGYRFVPFKVATHYLSGLQIRTNEHHHNPILYALFNDQIDVQAQTVGDTSYGAAAWLRADAQNQGRWIIGPPTTSQADPSANA